MGCDENMFISFNFFCESWELIVINDVIVLQ